MTSQHDASATATTVLLTRHGHVDWIAPERFRGRAELALSDLGRRQATALSSHIAAHWQPEAIFTSPRVRCIDTGAAIAQATGASAKPLPGLDDIDYGLWQGLTHDEVRSQWHEELRAWLSVPHMAAIPGGESLAKLYARTTQALHKVLQSHRGKVIVVGHDSVNRALLIHALGLPLGRYWNIKQSPCTLNQLKFADDSFVIESVNETQHLLGVAS